MPCAIATLATDAPAPGCTRPVPASSSSRCTSALSAASCLPSCPPKLRGHDPLPTGPNSRARRPDAYLPGSVGSCWLASRFPASTSVLPSSAPGASSRRAKPQVALVVAKSGQVASRSHAPLAHQPSTANPVQSWRVRAAVAARREALPNPSLVGTATGKALGPRTGQCHHPSRGPSAFRRQPSAQTLGVRGRYCVRGPDCFAIRQCRTMTTCAPSPDPNLHPLCARGLVRRGTPGFHQLHRCQSRSRRHHPWQRRLSKGSLVSRRYG